MNIFHSSKYPAQAAFLCLAFAAGSCFAQTSISTASPPSPAADVASIEISKATLANEIIAGKVDVPDGLVRAKAIPAPTWAKIDVDANNAGIEMDVGHRLLAGEHAAAALYFFNAAEASLRAVVARTPDSEVQAKVGYLKNLALLHGRCLGMASQGFLDLKQASLLAPNDTSIQVLRDLISCDKAEVLRAIR